MLTQTCTHMYKHTAILLKLCMDCLYMQVYIVCINTPCQQSSSSSNEDRTWEPHPPPVPHSCMRAHGWPGAWHHCPLLQQQLLLRWCWVHCGLTGWRPRRPAFAHECVALCMLIRSVTSQKTHVVDNSLPPGTSMEQPGQRLNLANSSTTIKKQYMHLETVK